jgi:predicted signal transduction protein with EAL and GGDEF domain
LTASIEVVVYPKDGDTQEVLLQRADTAINAAKTSGKNCIAFFKPEFEDSIFNKHNIENDLREDIKEEQLSTI